jgi:hypothetical protein
LGDLVAGTVVVYRTKQTTASDHFSQQAALIPGMRFSVEEQRALIAFAERADHISESRQAELADILAPVTAGSGLTATQTLHAYANWFRGRRD